MTKSRSFSKENLQPSKKHYRASRSVQLFWHKQAEEALGVPAALQLLLLG